MASALEEFFHFIESGRCQDATKHRQAAQKEFFEAKNRLGRHERRECESIDQIFSFIEKGHFEETNALITNAKAVFHRRIKPVVQSLQVSKNTFDTIHVVIVLSHFLSACESIIPD